MNTITRRDFLKGSLAGSASLALAGFLGFSSSAEAHAEEIESLGAPDESYEADVVIVGAGAAGLQAALNLCRDGKKVIIVEKAASAYASNFAMCGGPTACGTNIQAAENATVTLDTIFDHMYDFSRGSVNGRLLRKVLSCTGKAINTMDDLGIPMFLMEDTYGVGFRGRHMFMADGIERIDPLKNDIEANGGKFIFSTAVSEIVMKDGHAVGVKGKSGDKVIEVDASAVLVCTGGFLGGEDMQKEHFNTTVFPLGNTLSDGTGIKMIQAAGGVLDRNFAVLGNECGAVSKATTSWPFTPEWFNKNEHYGYWLFGGLYVDPSGERFVNEGDVAKFPLAKGGEAILRAGKAYVIMDDKYYQGVKANGIYATLGQPEEWVSGAEADYYRTTEENADAHLHQAIDEGWAIKADSIEEIAEKFGLSYLPETVKTYNEYCAAGKDDDFGKPACFLYPVEHGPFYAFEYVPSAWGTNGGVKVDSHLRALDSDNLFIPGLYVAGVDAGSMYSSPYYDNEGSSVGLAVGSGVLAAKEIEEFLM